MKITRKKKTKYFINFTTQDEQGSNIDITTKINDLVEFIINARYEVVTR